MVITFDAPPSLPSITPIRTTSQIAKNVGTWTFSPLRRGSSLFSRISLASVPSSIKSNFVITPMVLRPPGWRQEEKDSEESFLFRKNNYILQLCNNRYVMFSEACVTQQLQMQVTICLEKKSSSLKCAPLIPSARLSIPIIWLHGICDAVLHPISTTLHFARCYIKF